MAVEECWGGWERTMEWRRGGQYCIPTLYSMLFRLERAELTAHGWLYKSTSHETPSAPLLGWSFKPTLMHFFFLLGMMWYIFSFLWGSIHSVGEGWVDIFNKSLISSTLTLFWTDLLKSSGTCSAREVELWSRLHRCSTNHKNRLSILPFTQALENQPVTLCYFAGKLQRSNGGGGPGCWTSVDAIRCSPNQWLSEPQMEI